MPYDLQLATAELALFYASDPLASVADHTQDFEAGSNLARPLVGLPLSIQGILFTYLRNDLKGIDLYKEINKKIEVDTPTAKRNVAKPLDYV